MTVGLPAGCFLPCVNVRIILEPKLLERSHTEARRAWDQGAEGFLFSWGPVCRCAIRQAETTVLPPSQDHWELSYIEETHIRKEREQIRQPDWVPHETELPEDSDNNLCRRKKMRTPRSSKCSIKEILEISHDIQTKKVTKRRLLLRLKLEAWKIQWKKYLKWQNKNTERNHHKQANKKDKRFGR